MHRSAGTVRQGRACSGRIRDDGRCLSCIHRRQWIGARDPIPDEQLCRALKRVRETLGFTNVIIMVPFCRTPAEADRVLGVMAENGLRCGDNGLQVYMMCEIPSNVILAEAFAKRFHGFSIGSNDLTQLGVDRDSDLLATLFDERDEAVMRMVSEAIRKAHAADIKIGICGQAPSNYPDFAAFLVNEGIDSISLNPDSFVRTMTHISRAEQSAFVSISPAVLPAVAEQFR